MSEDDRHARQDRGKLLFVVALVLALAATGALVFTDSAVWLRFAVLAALWSAMVGGSVALGYRRRYRERENEAAELRSRYEIELEREVSARREYELEVETEIRKEIENSATVELRNLREELRSLQENVDAMLGGEVLVERVALRAESTRMRSRQDFHRQPPPESAAPTMRRPPVEAPASSAPAGRPEPRQPHRPPAPAATETGQAPPARPALPPPPVDAQRRVDRVPPAAGEPGRPGPAGGASTAAVAGRRAATGNQPARESDSGYRVPVPPRTNGVTRRAPEPVASGGAREPARYARHTPDGDGVSGQPEASRAESGGAHAEGTSVTELLAAHGGAAGGRRHRRREE